MNIIHHMPCTRLPMHVDQSWRWLLLGCLLCACDPSEGGPSSALSSLGSASPSAAAIPSAISTVATASSAAASAATAPVPAAAFPAAAAACSAPSLGHRRPIDAFQLAAEEPCVALARTPKASSAACGTAVGPAVDIDTLDATAPRLDAITLAQLRKVARKGKQLGRRPHVVGLIGDSMTVSAAFMRDFGSADEGVVLSAAVRRRLATTVNENAEATIIDYYRRGRPFRAPRAAKVGARAAWANSGEGAARVAAMLRQASPAVVVVLFGGNDAAYSSAAPEVIAKRFVADMTRLLDHLEAQGVIVVMNTLARHADAPGVPACGSRGHMGDWRLAINTNALSRQAAQLACERQLPLVDLRHALDALPHHGLSSDGVHPSYYRQGSMRLDGGGLQCGYNVRNYVTLRMLKYIKEQVLDLL